jgi:hypothetical protein
MAQRKIREVVADAMITVNGVAGVVVGDQVASTSIQNPTVAGAVAGITGVAAAYLTAIPFGKHKPPSSRKL